MGSSMKIVLLHDNAPSQGFAGATVSTHELALGLKEAGQSVYLVTTCRLKKDAGEFEQDGIKIYRILSNYPSFWRAYLSLYNPPVVREVKRILSTIRPDVVHANNVHFHLSYHCLKIAKKYAKTVVFTARDVMTFNYGKLVTRKYLENLDAHTTWLDHLQQAGKRWNPLRNFLIKKYLRYVDQMFAVSGALKKALAQNGIKNASVMHTGINLADWQIDEIITSKLIKKYNLTDKKVILFSGRLSGAKGGGQALEALVEISPVMSNAVLLVAGKIDHSADQIRARAEQLGLADKLIFTGWLEQEESKKIYAVADVVLVPSICFDSLPRVVLEAMAMSKPVVGTVYGGAAEAIVDGVTGYVVNPFDTKKMAEKIINLLQNPQQAQQMGEAGCERIRNEFNLKTKVAEYITGYGLKPADEHKDGSVLAVDQQKWLAAQEFERSCWVKANQNNSRSQILLKFLRALKRSPKNFFELLWYRDFYAGDDWNFWWKKQFDNYRTLPAQIGKALEVGCGPHTNIRLISRLKKINEIYCIDPLMDLYLSFKLNWLAEMAKKGKIFTSVGKGESLEFPDDSFDLVICNNVLDHVQDTSACLSEIHRVLKPGGYFVFGQDLSDEADIAKQRQEDRGFVGHPIKLHDQTLDGLLDGLYEIKMKKVLPRAVSRNPRHHYGTYIFVGIKRL